MNVKEGGGISSVGHERRRGEEESQKGDKAT